MSVVDNAYMHLRDYLQRRGVTAHQCAREIGVEPKTVYRHLAGERMPCPRMIATYGRWSRGLVKPQDFYPPEKDRK